MVKIAIVMHSDNTYKTIKERHCEKGALKKQLHYEWSHADEDSVRLAPAKVCDLHFAGDSDSDRSFITPIKLFHLLLSCVRKSFRLCCCWSCDSMRCCFRRCLCPIRCVAGLTVCTSYQDGGITSHCNSWCIPCTSYLHYFYRCIERILYHESIQGSRKIFR